MKDSVKAMVTATVTGSVKAMVTATGSVKAMATDSAVGVVVVEAEEPVEPEGDS